MKFEDLDKAVAKFISMSRDSYENYRLSETERIRDYHCAMYLLQVAQIEILWAILKEMRNE